MRRLGVILAAMVAVAVLVVGVGTAERGPTATTAAAPAPITVRVTFYLDRGVMYSGYQTHWSATACSWNFPLGTQFALPDGFVVTCMDRGGGLGSAGWLDIWVPDLATGRWLQRVYGDWAVVEPLRWGW